MQSKYQILPPLNEQEYETLKNSIDTNGLEYPVIVDENGEIVDGFHRQRACEELKVKCSRIVREFESESEKYELALSLNCNRRHLSQNQKRRVIEGYLLRDPQIANNNLADLIGLSKNTVASVREHLEATGQIDKFEKLRGRDGKLRNKKQNKILANSNKEAEKAYQIIGDLPDSCTGKTYDMVTANRRARRNKSAIKRKEEIESVAPVNEDDIRLYHTRFQDLEKIAGIEPESINLICTDIPYGKEFLPEIEGLAEFAERVLVEGGIFLTYSGNFYLPQVMDKFEKHLTYRWQISSHYKGDATLLSLGSYKVTSSWKPILVYSKGETTRKGRFNDSVNVQSKEKAWHHWQQPLDEAVKLIHNFSSPGDLVVDPCGGGFTTAIACRNLNRRYIGCDVEPECVSRGIKRLQLTQALSEYVEDAVDIGRTNLIEMLMDWAHIHAVTFGEAADLFHQVPDEIKQSIDCSLITAI
jgi:site-specific DNA-methyltransferase (adenine-specific)